ncbi:MAG TPA: DUF445 family protein [Spirochaetales bacterium]|nr:DUF445 family protein [Spirochaetales bacterium]
MKDLLPWVLPPAIGAVIGWFTNALAIKMLFRPYREHRLFGLRIPFTPGILPREKARLAASIGDSVASDLLTPEVLRERLEAPDLRSKVAQAAGSVVDSLLDAKAATLLDGGLLASPGGTLARGALDSLWRGFLTSGALASGVESAAFELLQSLSERRLDEIAPPGRLAELAARFAGSPAATRARELAATLAGGAVERALGSGLRPDDVLPLGKALGAFDAATGALMPALEAALSRYLDEPSVRVILERYGAAMVRKEIDRLGTLQRLLVNAGGYERSIIETMPKAIDDLVDAIRKFAFGPEGGNKLAAWLRARLELVWMEPLANHALLKNGAASTFAASLAGTVAERLLAAARDEKLEGRLSDLLSKPEIATVGAVLETLGPDTARVAAKLAARAALAALSGLAGAGTSRAAAAFAGGAASALGDATVGELGAFDERWRDEAADVLAGMVIALAVKETPRALEGIDVSRLVRERIEALDMRELEAMVLRVVDRELFWITALGGILGFLIGALQSLLSLVGI